MSEQVKRYDGQMMLGGTAIAAGFKTGMVTGRDYDALHAEAEALRAENGRLNAELSGALTGIATESQAADHYRTQLEAARGLLERVEKHYMLGMSIYGECEDIRAFLTAIPAPEVQAEQGERQEAWAMRSVGHWEKSFAAIWPEDEAEQDGPWVIGTIDEDGNKYPVVTIDADQYDAPGDSKLLAEKLQALWAAAFTTPQPGTDVRGLASFALELIAGAWKGGSFDGGDIQEAGVRHGLLVVEQREESCGERCDCSEYGFPAECYRLTPALAAHRQAQRQGESHES